MKNSIKKLCIIPGFLLISSAGVKAFDLDIDAHINIKTVYIDCTKYAEKIREFTEAYVKTKNDSHKAYYYERIKKKKRKLKKCEKDNRNQFKNKEVKLDSWKIGIGGTF